MFLKTSRNQLLNIIEAVATYFVVFIHIPFPGYFGNMITALARVTVPFYFCISGFFFFYTSSEKLTTTIKRKTIRLLKTLLISECIYYMFYVFLQIKNVGFSFIAFSNVIRDEFFDYYVPDLANRIAVFSPVFNGVTWFIATLIVVYLIEFFITKFNLHKTSLFVFVFSLIICFVGRRILIHYGIKTPFPYERIIIFLPLPFFEIGYAFNIYRAQIEKIKRPYEYLIIIFGIIITIVESFSKTVHTIYLGTLFIIFGLFICFIHNPEYSPKSLIAKTFSFIGANLTTNIYVYHMLISMFIFPVINILFPSLQDNIIYLWIKPLLVCFIITLLSYTLYLIKSFIIKCKNNKFAKTLSSVNSSINQKKS